MNAKISIQKKILIFVPIVLVSLALLAYLSYQSAKQAIEEEINDKMLYLSNDIEHFIDGQLMSHQRLGETMAQTIKAFGSELTREQYHQLMADFIQLNDDTYGMGVWFEPNQYNAALEYFGPYAYKMVSLFSLLMNMKRGIIIIQPKIGINQQKKHRLSYGQSPIMIKRWI
ncbi:hypothetical protein [Halolactibacillus sp. JCM 19043]|uniref:hypothetical protein n=1 Tax=Halolactibacillus sp. JCM 19043 TaxID=1460638 RepID=UPI000784A25C|nr:hypothetical protein [Halolactibacillus sp. JCM 19043]